MRAILEKRGHVCLLTHHVSLPGGVGKIHHGGISDRTDIFRATRRGLRPGGLPAEIAVDYRVIAGQVRTRVRVVLTRVAGTGYVEIGDKVDTRRLLERLPLAEQVVSAIGRYDRQAIRPEEIRRGGLVHVEHEDVVGDGAILERVKAEE